MNPLSLMTKAEADAKAMNCNLKLQSRISTQQAERLADIFRALSHPVRLQMLDLISQRNGEVCGCDIEQHFTLTQPTISHHLKVLRDCGLITSQPHGVWVHHRVNAQLLNTVRDLLTTMHGPD